MAWSGADDANGTGIAAYNVYVSDNGGAYTLFQSQTTNTSATFTGQDGHKYSFYSVATDHAGNVEQAPTTPDATTLVDLTAPSSSVSPLAAAQQSTNINLSWSGSDGANGSGIAGFDIYVSDNSGTFTLWKHESATTTSDTFAGTNGHSYAFYSRATDNAGNVEDAPAIADATTLIDATLPASSVAALPQYETSTSFTVSWSGTDAGGPGIASYSVFVSTNGGAFTAFQTNTTQTSATFTGTSGNTYGFYSVATDSAGNVQPTPVSAQATTSIFTVPPTSSVSALPQYETSASFSVSWSGTDSAGPGIATYGVFVSTNGGAYTAFQTNTTQTSATFTGTSGNTYSFYSVATDKAGNVQPTPVAAQATTSVFTVPPTSSVAALPQYETSASFTVSWSGTDAGGPGIASYSVFVSTNGGAFTAFHTNTTQTSATFTGTSGNTYGFYSVATDNAGNVQAIPVSAQATTSIFTVPPASSVSALPQYETSASFSVSWSGTDSAGPGIATYGVFVSTNGGAFTAFQTNTTQTSATFTGTTGNTYSFYSVATDKAGNVQATPATAQASTTVFTVPPTSSVTAAATQYETSTSFTVSWSGTDAAGPGIASYNVFVSTNGGAFTAFQTNTTQTSATFTGTSGNTYGFYSVATDKAGNVQAAPVAAQASTSVFTVPPTSGVSALPQYETSTSFTVSWSGTDSAGPGIATYSVFVSTNGGVFTAFQTNTAQTSATFTGTSGNTYSFYSVATDRAGNVQAKPGTAQASTTIDSVPPTSSVTVLPSTETSTSFTVSWSGSDTGGSGIASYSVFVSTNGGAFSASQTNTTQTSATFTGSTGNTYGFYSIATDKAGNVQPTPAQAQTSTTINTTTKLPTSSVAALPQYESSKSFTVNWSGTDAGGPGIASYNVFVSTNGDAYTTFQTKTTKTSATFTGTSGNTYSFYSVATDKSGNVQSTPAQAQASTTIDTVSPTSSVAALPQYETVARSFTINWSGTDVGGAGIASYSIFVSTNGGQYKPFQTNTTQTSATYSGASGSTYSFYSVATDQAGHVQPTPTKAQASTSVYTAPPTSTVTALPQYETKTSFTVSWSGTDTGGPGIASYSVFFSTNGGAYTAFQTNTTKTSATFTGASGNTYSFYSVATDKAGNVQATPTKAQTSTSVYTVPPTSSVAALPQYETSSSFSVSWSGTDAAGPGIASYSVFVSTNGGAYTAFQTNTTKTFATFTGTSGKTYSFYSIATDKAGNVQAKPTTAQASTTVYTVPPTSSVVALPQIETSTSFTVSWSGSDSGGPGTAGYSVFVSINGGAYTALQTNTTQTSATFTGAVGNTYSFYSIATDKAGNVQPTPTKAQASTTIKIGTTTLLASSLSPSVSGQSVLFTATLEVGNSTATGATGTVTFKDGSSVLATETVQSGVATFSTSMLAVGSHTITAVYNGAGNYVGSTSKSVVQTVQSASLQPGAGGVQNLIVGGSTGNDSFAFSLGATAGQIVVHENGKTVGTFSPTGSVLITGNGGKDSITVSGGSKADSFTIDPGQISLDGVQYIGTGITSWAATGGNGNDTFAIDSGASAVVTGGHGVNTLIGPNASNTWTISGSGSGALGSSISFSNIENLTGGAGSDVFQFTSVGGVTGTVNGGAGVNTIDDSKMIKPITVNLETDSATNIGGFSNIQSIIAPGSQSNTMIGPNADELWSITGTNSGTVAGIAFQNFSILTGGKDADTFQFTSAGLVRGRITGGGGWDTLDYSQTAASLNVNLLTQTATSTGGVTGISEVLGGAGAATLTANNTNVVLVAGSGKTTLVGGSGNDILIGGAGGDTLTPGSGRSILIGGSGLSTVNGGSADDLLIGGTVSYYNEQTRALNRTALDAILAEWDSSDSYATRVARLSGTASGGSNGSNLLNASTVFDNNQADALNGGQSSTNDWFLAGANDKVKKNNSAEIVTII